MEKRVNGSSLLMKESVKENKKIAVYKPTNPLALMMKASKDNILELEFPGCSPLINKPRIRISHWNVNGIRASLKKKEAKDYFEDNQLDILCLNETKINKKKFFKCSLEK